MSHITDAENGHVAKVAYADPGIDDKLATKIEHHEETVNGANAAADKEHKMTIREALRVRLLSGSTLRYHH